MLLEIRKKIINAFIEPQFKDLGTGTLVTVQFSHWESLHRLRHHMNGEIWMSKASSGFTFTGYTHLLTIQFLCDRHGITEELLTVDTDYSPTPVAYYWNGWQDEVKNYASDEEEATDPFDPVLSVDGQDNWFGYVLPEDLESVWLDSDMDFDQFYVYPIFDNLKHNAKALPRLQPEESWPSSLS